MNGEIKINSWKRTGRRIGVACIGKELLSTGNSKRQDTPTAKLLAVFGSKHSDTEPAATEQTVVAHSVTTDLRRFM
jgi:hypothetical protein